MSANSDKNSRATHSEDLKMTPNLKLSASALALCLVTSAVSAETYGPYPITEKSYSGDKTNSVAYTGQVERTIMKAS